MPLKTKNVTVMKFEWITNWETIWSDTFVNQWHEWMEESENSQVFFHPAMVKAWVDTYMSLRDIHPMFCIVSSEKYTIFIPMIIWKRNWKNAFLRYFIPVGYSDFDYQAPIVVGDLSCFDWIVFWLDFQNEIEYSWKNHYDILEIDGIKEEFAGSLKKWEKSDECPYIDLRPYNSYEAFLGYFKSKQRNDIQRQIRRLEEEGSFRFEIMGKEKKATILNLLPTILYHHTLRWPNAYKALNYHYNLISNSLDAGLLHFSQISINDQAIGWNISFIYKKTYYFYMPVYVEKYANFSPGKLTMFLCINDMISKGYEKFDLLRGAEEYKNKLPVHNSRIFRYTEENSLLTSRVKNKLLTIRKRVI